MATILGKKVPDFFLCEFCDYSTSRKSHYDRHLLTTKHHKTTLDYKKGQKKYQEFQTVFCCENCNKIYKHHSSLWKHKKTCFKSSELVVNTCGNLVDKEIIQKLIDENKEFKNIIIDQSKTLQELATKVGTNCNNNINSNNKSFNLNFFLNETCKDAINISDFVSSIKIDFDDLEKTGRIGYAGGISSIFSHNLKDMDTRMRPIHCTDLKREILYIKENGVWEKDSDSKMLLIKAIKAIAFENIKQINEWKKQYPDCTDSDSHKNDLYLKIVSNSMCGIDKEETEKNLAKIVSNVAKEVVIEKSENIKGYFQ
jgi:hypothetical protein